MDCTLVYLVAYAGTLACIGAIAYKVRSYIKKPVHVRWELYPVAHDSERAAYGGSYLEDADWWKNRQKPSFIAGMKGLLIELLFLHLTLETNTKLWYRTYPFHLGLYLLIGGILFTCLTAVARIMGIEPGIVLTAMGNIVQVLSVLGFLGLIAGGAGLLHRRLSQPDLKRYSTREHFINLCAFILLGLIGLLTWLGNPSFFVMARDFTVSMITFSFAPMDSFLFSFYITFGFIMAAYVPMTHMGHFFMKYFLYHDIRWADQPTQDNPATQKKIGIVLGFPVSWKASHIQGDGKKTWAEVATTNPTKPKE
ncbi:MAG: nitrate reductase [Desulfovibrio sp.]|jgi:nitrate reductase gamma subunit|nr:nitrate reductase [Desulfovibrio sp.]